MRLAHSLGSNVIGDCMKWIQEMKRDQVDRILGHRHTATFPQLAGARVLLVLSELYLPNTVR